MIKPTLAFSVLSALACAITLADDAQPFKINMKRTSDRVEIKSDTDKSIFVVHSPFGISTMAIDRTTERWPNKVVIHLRLSGLENFTVSTATQKLQASISSQDGRVRLWKDGNEDSLLEVTSPYWMDICMVGSDGRVTKTIPLKDGYFEIPLPKPIFEGNPKSISLNWIDFYR